MGVDPYKYFRVEAAELHESMGRGVLALERGVTDPDLVPRLLRLAHTLKGAARVVKQRRIADHAHAIEEVLEPLRGSELRADPARIEALFGLLDGIDEAIRALGPSASAEIAITKPSVSRVLVEPAPRGVHADVATMDELRGGLGEARAQLEFLREGAVVLERARRALTALVEQLASPQASAAAAAQTAARDVELVVAAAVQKLSSSVDQIEQELVHAHEAAERMRLTPASSLFIPLERTARDAAQVQGKAVLFEARGEVRLDAQILGVVHNALLQLVRNAVAHGIETATERRAAGKPAEGRVALTVTRQGRRASFVCSDDGRGIDAEALRREAKRRVTTGEFDAAPLLDLLLRGRVSTSGVITELSGRGIGLDVLREAAERLGGEVDVRTERGKGTTIELRVPLTLASLDALRVEVGGHAVAIPLDAVRSTLRARRGDISCTSRGSSLLYGDRPVPFTFLGQLIARELPAEGAAFSAVIVEGASGLAAVGVDRLLGTSTVVQHPLPELGPAADVIAGVWMDAAGIPRLVLDADGVVAATTEATAVSATIAVRRHRILVVDDSLTTRILEQSILESAGYEVTLAASAEEGLELATQQPFSLALVDVEMPGMDGLSFVRRTREDPSLRGIPCILVTSRAAPEDRRRGEEAGARGYVDKNEFDQLELLAQIRRLVA